MDSLSYLVVARAASNRARPVAPGVEVLYSGLGHGETAPRRLARAHDRRPRVRWRGRRAGGRLRRLRARGRAGRPPPREARRVPLALRPGRDRGGRDPLAGPGRGALPLLRALRRPPGPARPPPRPAPGPRGARAAPAPA